MEKENWWAGADTLWLDCHETQPSASELHDILFITSYYVIVFVLFIYCACHIPFIIFFDLGPTYVHTTACVCNVYAMRLCAGAHK